MLYSDAFLLLLGWLFCMHPAATSQSSPDSYLTRDGRLTGRLELNDLQGGTVGFTGTRWIVEPAGEWTTAHVVGRDAKVTNRGRLTAKQLETLAATLKQYDVLQLPKRTGTPTVNPHLINISYGGRRAELTLSAGQSIPTRHQNKKPDATARVGGTLREVRTLIPELQKDQRNERRSINSQGK
jgi:hypothetical protein